MAQCPTTSTAPLAPPLGLPPEAGNSPKLKPGGASRGVALALPPEELAAATWSCLFQSFQRNSIAD